MYDALGNELNPGDIIAFIYRSHYKMSVAVVTQVIEPPAAGALGRILCLRPTAKCRVVNKQDPYQNWRCEYSIIEGRLTIPDSNMVIKISPNNIQAGLYHNKNRYQMNRGQMPKADLEFYLRNEALRVMQNLILKYGEQKEDTNP
jgi:hypothetical protein